LSISEEKEGGEKKQQEATMGVVVDEQRLSKN